MAVNHQSEVGAEREHVATVRDQIESLIRELETAKRPGMLVYLLSMAKLECDDIVNSEGNYAPNHRH